MSCKKIEKTIVKFLKNKTEGCPLVVGVSGGVDSGVTSTLCALTGQKVYALGLPCKNNKKANANMNVQLNFLKKKFRNVITKRINLFDAAELFAKKFPGKAGSLTMANTKSRLRMVMLYMFAGQYGGRVIGTGNKNEDFILYFFTKFGDGGVDLSPIGDLYKSEVYELAAYFRKTYGLPKQIAAAVPTDGLWLDGRTDEEQLGISYDTAQEIWEKLEELGMTNPKALKLLLNDSVRESIPAFTGATMSRAVKKVIEWNLKGRHKGHTPEICQVK